MLRALSLWIHVMRIIYKIHLQNPTISLAKEFYWHGDWLRVAEKFNYINSISWKCQIFHRVTKAHRHMMTTIDNDHRIPINSNDTDDDDNNNRTYNCFLIHFLYCWRNSCKNVIFFAGDCDNIISCADCMPTHYLITQTYNRTEPNRTERCIWQSKSEQKHTHTLLIAIYDNMFRFYCLAWVTCLSVWALLYQHEKIFRILKELD